MTDVRRLVGAMAGTILAAVVVVPIGVGPASAASDRCAPGTGVTVVVDYGALGGGTVIGCDPDGGGKSAAAVTTAAGFSLSYVLSQPGFVCRVNGQPAESEQDCQDTPPPDRYWGLFRSDGDPQTWAYSSEGAGSLDVPEGGSIGWRFQDGGDRDEPGAPPTAAGQSASPQPSKPSPQPSKPPQAAKPTPAPTPAASVPPGTEGSGSTPGEKANPDRDGRDGAGESDGPGTKAGDKGGDKGRQGDKKGKDERGRKHRDKAHPEQAAAPSEAPTVAAIDPASTELKTDDGSSVALTWVAGAAVLLLAAAAGLIAWRRRA